MKMITLMKMLLKKLLKKIRKTRRLKVMSKVISVLSLRNGVGRSTIAALLSLELTYDGKVLVIDNNYKFNDLENYLMIEPQYNIDDLKPFFRGDNLDKSTTKSIITNIENNLDILCGSKMKVNNTLSSDELIKLIEIVRDDYDYIVVDNKAGIHHEEVLNLSNYIDHGLFISHQNKYDYANYLKQYKSLDNDNKKKINEIMEKSFFIYNRLSEDANLDIKEVKKDIGSKKIYKIYFDNKIIDFLNGYNKKINNNTSKILDKLLIQITGKEPDYNKVQLVGKKLKSILSS
ncbi:ParA family protein [Senegalia massiliensis]|uniref:ParA family protein n=2 Tax=Senegalia massiliensis TaxID=1720316 RepID=A0A845R0R0_9CLOT|nr:ParA family protein [Senegalia massiliensis]